MKLVIQSLNYGWKIQSFDLAKVKQVLNDICHLEVRKNFKPKYQEAEMNLVRYRGEIVGNEILETSNGLRIALELEGLDEEGPRLYEVKGQEVTIIGSLDCMSFSEEERVTDHYDEFEIDACWSNCRIEKVHGDALILGQKRSWYSFKRYQLKFPEMRDELSKEFKNKGFEVEVIGERKGYLLKKKNGEKIEGAVLLTTEPLEELPMSFRERSYEFKQIAPDAFIVQMGVNER